MSSLRDKAHVGVFVYIQSFNIRNSNWICQKLASEQLQTRASGTVRIREGGMDRPSQKSHLFG
jgi:hypothetical protein